MKKSIVALTVFLTGALVTTALIAYDSGWTKQKAKPLPLPQGKELQLKQKIDLKSDKAFPIIKFPADSLCAVEGKQKCDLENGTIKRCQSGNWVTILSLSEEELNLAKNCEKLKECWPGEYLCNLRDHDYRYCKEDGTWWPGGNGWGRIPGESTDPARHAEILRNCAINEARYHDGIQHCWPGQYRCLHRDHMYNTCGEGGFWSQSGDIPGSVTRFDTGCY